ncbi:DDE-type integrase/transposase/recombinase [Aliiroseovarius sp. PTFE2010]|uniref:DDE-type integrase/transposase/recombinase n=1 Tax=Aliiroseovarius sp. PTFE2010 TaxID=3417190 RepID=UPI003CE7D888
MANHTVQRSAPKADKRGQRRRCQSERWRVGATHIKVHVKGVYLFRGANNVGNTIGHRLSPPRNIRTTERFFAAAPRSLKFRENPRVINMAKAPNYAFCLSGPGIDSRCPKEGKHRQIKYMHNIVKADHGRPIKMIELVCRCKTQVQNNEIHLRYTPGIRRDAGPSQRPFKGSRSGPLHSNNSSAHAQRPPD